MATYSYTLTADDIVYYTFTPYTNLPCFIPAFEISENLESGDTLTITLSNNSPTTHSAFYFPWATKNKITKFLAMNLTGHTYPTFPADIVSESTSSEIPGKDLKYLTQDTDSGRYYFLTSDGYKSSVLFENDWQHPLITPQYARALYAHMPNGNFFKCFDIYYCGSYPTYSTSVAPNTNIINQSIPWETNSSVGGWDGFTSSNIILSNAPLWTNDGTATTGTYSGTDAFSGTAAAADLEPFVQNNNPYGDNPDAPGAGGDGSRTDWSDTIAEPELPTANILDLGMSAVYTPTEAQLASLSEYLWSDLFSTDTIKKLFADPMSALISLHMLPFAVTHGLASEIRIGGVGTGVNADILGSQWYTVDCGTISIDKYFGSFFDYSPYTTYQIYLPYIGYQTFIPDDFVGGTCQVVYHVDAITGACVAQLISSAVDGSVLYQYGGSLAYQIPLTQNSYTSAIQGVVSAVASAGLAIAGGVLGKTAGTTVASTVTNSALSAVSAAKPNVTRSGSVGGPFGWAGIQTPYIIRIRPNAVLPKNAQSYQGFPTYEAFKLSSLSGFTKVLDCNLSLNGATSSEYDEALALLKEGVII